jgi:hypothetical protein
MVTATRQKIAGSAFRGGMGLIDTPEVPSPSASAEERRRKKEREKKEKERHRMELEAREHEQRRARYEALNIATQMAMERAMRHEEERELLRAQAERRRQRELQLEQHKLEAEQRKQPSSIYVKQAIGMVGERTGGPIRIQFGKSRRNGQGKRARKKVCLVRHQEEQLVDMTTPAVVAADHAHGSPLQTSGTTVTSFAIDLDGGGDGGGAAVPTTVNKQSSRISGGSVLLPCVLDALYEVDDLARPNDAHVSAHVRKLRLDKHDLYFTQLHIGVCPTQSVTAPPLTSTTTTASWGLENHDSVSTRSPVVVSIPVADANAAVGIPSSVAGRCVLQFHFGRVSVGAHTLAHKADVMWTAMRSALEGVDNVNYVVRDQVMLLQQPSPQHDTESRALFECLANHVPLATIDATTVDDVRETWKWRPELSGFVSVPIVQSMGGKGDVIAVACLTVDAPARVGVEFATGKDGVALVVDPKTVLDTLHQENAWVVLG